MPSSDYYPGAGNERVYIPRDEWRSRPPRSTGDDWSRDELLAITHDIDLEKKRITFTVAGLLTIEDARACADEVEASLGNWRGLEVLVDSRRARWRLAFAELEQVARLTQQLNQVAVRKVAVVASDNPSGDVAEIILAYIRSTDCPMCLFEGMKEAEAWLERLDED